MSGPVPPALIPGALGPSGGRVSPACGTWRPFYGNAPFLPMRLSRSASAHLVLRTHSPERNGGAGGNPDRGAPACGRDP